MICFKRTKQNFTLHCCRTKLCLRSLCKNGTRFVVRIIQNLTWTVVSAKSRVLYFHVYALFQLHCISLLCCLFCGKWNIIRHYIFYEILRYTPCIQNKSSLPYCRGLTFRLTLHLWNPWTLENCLICLLQNKSVTNAWNLNIIYEFEAIFIITILKCQTYCRQPTLVLYLLAKWQFLMWRRVEFSSNLPTMLYFRNSAKILTARNSNYCK